MAPPSRQHASAHTYARVCALELKTRPNPAGVALSVCTRHDRAHIDTQAAPAVGSMEANVLTRLMASVLSSRPLPISIPSRSRTLAKRNTCFTCICVGICGGDKGVWHGLEAVKFSKDKRSRRDQSRIVAPETPSLRFPLLLVLQCHLH